MKLSQQTIEILNNFASINDFILIYKGNKQRIISNSKSLFVEAIIDETFPQNVPIYSLGQFLAVLSLFKEPEISNFNEKTIEINEADDKQVKQNIVYRLCDEKLISAYTPPLEKNIDFPSESLEQFVLESSVLGKFLKASSILGATHLQFLADGNKLYLKTLNAKDKNSSSSSVYIQDTTNEFSLNVNMDNLKLITSHDYEVKLSEKLIKFESKKYNLKYIMPIDKI